MSIDGELTCHSVAPAAGIAQPEVLLVPHLKSLTQVGCVVLPGHLLPTSPAKAETWQMQNIDHHQVALKRKLPSLSAITYRLP